MTRTSRAGLASTYLVVVALFMALASTVFGQEPAGEGAIVPVREASPPHCAAEPGALSFSAYADPVQGVSSLDLVRRALDSNRGLAAVRLDVDRARPRIRQPGLGPNPTLDFEHTSGRLAGSLGERETTVGFVLPLEVETARLRSRRAVVEGRWRPSSRRAAGVSSPCLRDRGRGGAGQDENAH